jgi:hypothetical protein
MGWVEYDGNGGAWTAGPWTNEDGERTTPQAGNNVYIYGESGDHTITSSSNVTVGSLSIDNLTGYDAHNTLTITAGTFAVGGSTNEFGDTLENFGTINVDSGAILKLAPTTPGDVVENGGTIYLAGRLEIDQSTVLENGGPDYPGQISVSAFGSIVSDGKAVTLSNGSTIEGGGTIGDQHLTLQNLGTIDATAAESMILNTGNNTIANYGTIEASSNGLLNIHSNVSNEAGTIEAQSKGVIDLHNVNVTAGVVKIDAGGTLDVVSGSLNAVSNATIWNDGSIDVNAGTSLYLSGGITNIGTLVTDGDLVVASPVTGNGTAYIKGDGTLDLYATFGESVSFSADQYGHSGMLKLENPTQFHGSVYGFASGDSIDLVGFGAHTKYSFSGGQLHVTDVEANGTHTANIEIVGSLTTASFHGALGGGGVIFTHA